MTDDLTTDPNADEVADLDALLDSVGIRADDIVAAEADGGTDEDVSVMAVDEVVGADDDTELTIVPASDAESSELAELADDSADEDEDEDEDLSLRITVVEERTRKQRKATRRAARPAWLDWGISIFMVVAVVLVVRTFMLAQFVVDGDSMSTTLSDGDRVVVNKMSYLRGTPSRGDIVVFETNLAEKKDVIKRVVALEGETIQIVDCKVRVLDPETLVNKVLVETEYLDDIDAEVCNGDTESITVGEGQVFVLGDNRSNSIDSRNYGPVNIDELEGRAFVVAFPFGSFTAL